MYIYIYIKIKYPYIRHAGALHTYTHAFQRKTPYKSKSYKLKKNNEDAQLHCLLTRNNSFQI